MVARAKTVLGTNPVAAAQNSDGTLNPYSGTQGIVAEPSIDYSYWKGNYRNASYVQAYGVAGLVDSAHSTWTAQCLDWLSTDTEANYFGRLLSALSSALAAHIAVPGTPASVGTSQPAPTPVVVPDTPTNTPTGSLALFQDKTNRNSLWNHYSNTPTDQTLKRSRLKWAAEMPHSFWSGIEWDPQCAAMKQYIDDAVAAGQVAQVLSYSIPGRDLGSYSAGGAANQAAYEAWIGKFIAAIGQRKVIVAYEPDSLVHADELSSEARAARLSVMKWAITKIKAECPNAYVYVDCGHPAWKSVDDAARLLQLVGVEKANGFVINVSNFRPDTDCITYGQAVCAKLNLPGVRFLFDSGRNGNGNLPTWRWANPADARFGRYPQFGNTGVDKCDGWIWWKAPGESDGNSGDGAPSAGTYWPTYIYNDAKGDNVGTDPQNDQVSQTSGMAQRPPVPGVEVRG